MSKRILLYGMNYAPEIAGVGRYSGDVGRQLVAEGHALTVVTAPPHYPGWEAADGFSATRWRRDLTEGAAIYRCPLYLSRNMRGWRRLLAPLSFALSSAPVALWQIVRRRPEVVIVVEPTLLAAPAALIAAKCVGAAAVLHVQDLEVDAAFAVGHLNRGAITSRLAARFERAVLARFDRVITISNRMAQRIEAKGVRAERLEIVRNWVDVDAITPLPAALTYRAELGLRADDFVVLYSGNLGAKQGIGLLVQTAERLAGRSRIVFVIAGRGPLRGDVEAAARRLPNIRLHDFQPEVRLGEFMAVADLHVLPQERDAADLVLPSKLGAMLASGRRVVVTADEGTELAEFLDGSCILTSPGDVEALAVAITAEADQGACAEAQAQRLKLAASLSKRDLLPRFTQAALLGNGAKAAPPALKIA